MDNEIVYSSKATDQKAQYDASAKRLLGQKIILAHILIRVVEEFKGMDADTVASLIEGEPYISQIPVEPGLTDKDTVDARTGERIVGLNTENSEIDEGKIYFDIIFYVRMRDGLAKMIINLEAQKNEPTKYFILNRAIFYTARLVSSQKERELTGSDYNEIKQVYSIWICMNPPKRRKNTINRYSITEECMVGEEKEKKENYDLMTAVIICLGDSENEHYSGIIKLLDVLLSDEQDPQKKKHILEEDFSVKMTRDLEREVSLMCNLSKGIEDRGMEKGLEQGLEQGMEHGLLSSIRNLMETMSWSSGQAMDALKIPRENRERYEQLLKQL